MRTKTCWLLLALLLFAAAGTALAATEEAKTTAIENGLVWLANTQETSGDEGYWPYSNYGTLAATATAALAFIEEGWLPGIDFEVNGTNYGDVVTPALEYILNRATPDGRFGVETAGYTRYAEDYNNDGDFTNDGGNDQAVYFNPGLYTRNVYTTGICVPVIYALGERLGHDTVIGMGSATVQGMTWAELLQDVIDWFSWGQVEPNRGVHRGGWRYDANYSTSDNSTAQWGALPLIYGQDWGLGAPDYVRNELELWVNYIQNANGGSGYDNPNTYVNVSKTGGLLLEMAVIGRSMDHPTVQAAINFINNRWNTYPSGTWYGNLNHPYAMWAVYKGLSVYGLVDNFTSMGEQIMVGTGIENAVAGYVIGFEGDTGTSATDDWYSHYCDYLVGIQNANGSWSGYSHWIGAMATSWYINILNATEVPEPVPEIAYVDIKPTSCPNPVNAKSMGVLPVAILGTEELDVTMIDQMTIELAGIQPLGKDDMSLPYIMGDEPLQLPHPIRYDYEDVAGIYEGEIEDCYSCTTEGPDGFMDMTLKFDTEMVIDALLAALPPEDLDTSRLCLKAMLTFSTIGGREYEGYDTILLLHSDDAMEPELAADAGISCYPNPFNPATTIEFAVGKPGHVELAVYNLAGECVRTLVSQTMDAGTHSTAWRADNQPSGVYFLILRTAEGRTVDKVTLLK